MPCRLSRVLALALFSSGCGLLLDLAPPDPAPGSDGGARDAGMDAGTDAGTDASTDASTDADIPRDPCTGQGDGVECATTEAERFLCIEGRCVESVCGDEFVDVDAGEECDDGNGVSGDGCEPVICRVGCASADACDDGLVCTLDACESGVCMHSLVPRGDPCSEASGDERICVGTRCVPAGCGNGAREDGEECDDGNGVDGDGCDTDCTFSCTEDAQCSDGDACTGIERCDATSHRCISGTPVRCTPESACVVASCDRSGTCISTLVEDRDGDGHAPSRFGACGTDCDDFDPTVHAGAPELCDGRDNDCDGLVDDDVVMVSCYLDADGDRYGSPEAPITACVCPAGRLTIAGDCFDGPGTRAELVHPAQRAFFSAPYCVTPTECRYDYDCNGAEERRWPDPGSECRAVLLSECAGGGWVGAVPACGRTGTWRNCSTLLGLGCRNDDSTRVQQCR